MKGEEPSEGATISGKILQKVTCPDPMGKLGGLVTPPSCPDPKQGVCAFILLNRTVWLMTKVGMQGRYVSTRHHQLSEPAGRVVQEPKDSPSKKTCRYSPLETQEWGQLGAQVQRNDKMGCEGIWAQNGYGPL